MRRCVWSRNLKNEEAMARVGPQRHEGGGGMFNYVSIFYISSPSSDLILTHYVLR